MVDATIVPVPKQRNSREDNEAVKAGKTPEEWEKKPAKNRQKILWAGRRDRFRSPLRSTQTDGASYAEILRRQQSLPHHLCAG
jgi:hypothetical protein